MPFNKGQHKAKKHCSHRCKSGSLLKNTKSLLSGGGKEKGYKTGVFEKGIVKPYRIAAKNRGKLCKMLMILVEYKGILGKLVGNN